MNPTTAIRILIAEHQIMFRETLRSLIEQDKGMQIVGEAGSGREALEQAAELRPDVVLIEITLPDQPVSETLVGLARVHPPARAIIIDGISDRRQVFESLKHGARGILPRQTTPQMLFKSIRAVAAGEYWVGHQSVADLIDYVRAAESPKNAAERNGRQHLTARESDIADAVVEGLTNKDIAAKLGISEETVKHHLTSIFDKTGVSNRLELALHIMHLPQQ